MELFDWLTALYGIWANLDADAVYQSSLAGMAELMRFGCTTCFDHHYVFPAGQTGLIDAQFEAAAALGIRLHASRGSMSLSKRTAGCRRIPSCRGTDAILADSRRLIETYHDPSPLSMRQVVLAPCSPFSVTADLLRESAALARAYGVRLHTHLCETKDEERFTLARTGLRPFAYMESLGWGRAGRVLRARHPLQRRGAGRAGRNGHGRCALPLLEHEALQRRHAPARDAAPRRARGPRRGRQRLQRRLQPARGDPHGLPAAPADRGRRGPHRLRAAQARHARRRAPARAGGYRPPGRGLRGPTCSPSAWTGRSCCAPRATRRTCSARWAATARRTMCSSPGG